MTEHELKAAHILRQIFRQEEYGQLSREDVGEMLEELRRMGLIVESLIAVSDEVWVAALKGDHEAID